MTLRVKSAMIVRVLRRSFLHQALLIFIVSFSLASAFVPNVGWIAPSSPSGIASPTAGTRGTSTSIKTRKHMCTSPTKLFSKHLWLPRSRKWSTICEAAIDGQAAVCTPTAAVKALNDTTSSTQQKQPIDVLVIAWDGCLVDTLDWRIQTGLKAAFEVWPELEVMTMGSDLTWLYNKIEAIQHELTAPVSNPSTDPFHHPAVEYGLAIRMLLEEQELDNGRSNGSKGKYGSRFHPAANDTAFASNSPPDTSTIISSPSDNYHGHGRRRRRQRPLTVGEIATNWHDSLREAAIFRYYREDKENPLDALHKVIVKMRQDNGNVNDDVMNPLLRFSDDVTSMLHSLRGDNEEETSSLCRVVVTVRHEMDLPVAQSSVESSLPHCPVHVIENVPELSVYGSEDSTKTILLLDQSSSASALTSLMKACSVDSSFHVVETAWSYLESYIPLFGDHIPRQPGGFGECILDVDEEEQERRILRLGLAEWASHVDAQSRATMNPWTNVMSLSDCTDVLSAK